MMAFLVLSYLVLGLQTGRIVVKVPGTGDAPPQAIVEQKNHDLMLVQIQDGKVVKETIRLGRRVTLPEPGLANIIPPTQPVTHFECLHPSSQEICAIATTGLRPDSGIRDIYTDKPVYTRHDDLFFISRNGQTFTKALTATFDAVEDLRIVRFSADRNLFFVASTFEGQHNSLIHVFGVNSRGKISETKFPEPDVDGRWEESVIKMDNSNVILISVTQYGNFADAPAGKKSREIRQIDSWNEAKQRFVQTSQTKTFQ